MPPSALVLTTIREVANDNKENRSHSGDEESPTLPVFSFVSPLPRQALSPVVPPLPNNLNECQSFEEVSCKLNVWMEMLSPDLKVHNQEIVYAMVNQIRELFADKFSLKPTVARLQEKLTHLRAPPGISCARCHWIPSDPYILPNCNHIYCGKCLEDDWRSVLETRMRTTTSKAATGHTLGELLCCLSPNQAGFNLALDLAGCPDDFTTYTSSCCLKEISSAPKSVDVLTKLCELLCYVESRDQHEYFKCFFRE
ncbi:hypothetical protein BDN72DRAFT_864785 [Pluteus cervinus]|uniref:Uncharacterized protein n=1 Tax=Pluteus cervinus TaxID=181527 RepID=A0ACD3A2S3_9AGAR|nr:hypothetical protein BDN72DRAFT_864785 [Pluteus cervinus]